MEEEKCCVRKKHREETEYKDLVTRLNRIEGQVRGIKRMVEDERYCVDILTQVTAIQAALNAFNKKLLNSHIHSCVIEDIKQDKEGAVDELCDIIQKLMK
ncbi:MAG TPA: metal-sensing transcriptional repressor [Lachnospiraceae bacterium]|nr:metal-sensing transcriptional repressor [Lachnospiraceae bacterium]